MVSRDELVEVLAGHYDITVDLTTPRLYTEHGNWNKSCVCGFFLGDGDDVYDFHRTHLADVLLPLIEGAKAEALEEAADGINLQRQVPRGRDELDDLCQDDACLWWDMTYALQDELRARAGEYRTTEG